MCKTAIKSKAQPNKKTDKNIKNLPIIAIIVGSLHCISIGF